MTKEKCTKCRKFVPKKWVGEAWVFCEGTASWYCPKHSPTQNCEIYPCDACNPDGYEPEEFDEKKWERMCEESRLETIRQKEEKLNYARKLKENHFFLCHHFRLN